MPYNSRSRVFSYTLSPGDMERILEDRGYTIVSLSRVARDFGYSRKTLLKELRLYPSTFDYKVAFKPEEKELVYKSFIDKISERRTDIEKRELDKNKYISYQGGKWFWFDYGDGRPSLYKNIVDVRVMQIINEEFKKSWKLK